MPGDAHADTIVSDAWISVRNTAADIDIDVLDGGFAIAARFTISNGALPDAAHVIGTFRGASFALAKEADGSFTSRQMVADLVEDEPLDVALAMDVETATASISLPLPFHIDSVTGSFCHEQVTWSPTSTDPMTWEAWSGSPGGNTCTLVLPMDRTVPDTGTFTFTECIIGSGPNCTTGRFLRRTRYGTLDGFLGGSIAVVQDREF